MLAEDAECDEDIPAALRNRPEVEPHLDLVWEAFSEVSTDRPSDSMGGTGPIPFSALDRYAERYGILEGSEFERFRALMRAMDGAYLKALRAKQERAGKR